MWLWSSFTRWPGEQREGGAGEGWKQGEWRKQAQATTAGRSGRRPVPITMAATCGGGQGAQEQTGQCVGVNLSMFPNNWHFV